MGLNGKTIDEKLQLMEQILHTVMIERIGERHASACQYKNRGTGGLTPLRSPDWFLAARIVVIAGMDLNEATKFMLMPAFRCRFL
jgi:hypothetical protein